MTGSQIVVRFSALRADRPLFPERFLVLISVRGWVDHRAAGRMKSIEKSNDLLWNLTHDLSICSIVPQPTTLPCKKHIRIFVRNHWRAESVRRPWRRWELTETNLTGCIWGCGLDLCGWEQGPVVDSCGQGNRFPGLTKYRGISYQLGDCWHKGCFIPRQTGRLTVGLNVRLRLRIPPP
jgi:hypothetical protein